jgi:hypothetical protein
LSQQILEGKLRRVGVIEFVNNSPAGTKLGGDTGCAGRYVAEKLEEGLVKGAMGRYKVVERQKLDAVIKEIKLQISDLVKKDALEKICGQIEGLDGLVIGTLTRMRERLGLSVKVVDPRTADNKGMASATAALTPDLAALFGESVFVPPQADGSSPGERVLLERVTTRPSSVAKPGHPLADPLNTMPYSVRLLVDGRALEPVFHGKEMYFGVSPGVRFAIELGNESDRRVAVALLLDGLSALGQEHVLPSQARKWVVGPHSKMVIRGWQKGPSVVREFLFTGAEQSLALRQGFYEDVGLITACFYPERMGGPIKVRGVRWIPGVAIGQGAEIESRIVEITMEHELTPEAIISLHYDLPEVVQKLR